MKDQVPELLEKKPWVTAEEGKDLTDKIDEARTWIQDKLKEQANLGLTADPVITGESVNKKAEAVFKLFKKISDKKISDKKKPKEKKPKDKEYKGPEKDKNGSDEAFRKF